MTLLRPSGNNTAAGSDSLYETAKGFDFMGMFQIYGAAPQFLGFMIEEGQYGANLSLGKIVVSSALSPIPGIGTPFRPYSGNMLYNTMMNRGNAADQVAPFIGELFLDLHLAGVLIGFSAVGWAVASLQNRYEAASSALEVYVTQFAAVWSSYLLVGSLDVVCHVAIYYPLPIYLYLLLRVFRAKKSRIDLYPQAADWSAS